MGYHSWKEDGREFFSDMSYRPFKTILFTLVCVAVVVSTGVLINRLSGSGSNSTVDSPTTKIEKNANYGNQMTGNVYGTLVQNSTTTSKNSLPELLPVKTVRESSPIGPGKYQTIFRLTIINFDDSIFSKLGVTSFNTRCKESTYKEMGRDTSILDGGIVATSIHVICISSAPFKPNEDPFSIQN